MFFTPKNRLETQTTNSTGGLSRISRKLTDCTKRQPPNDFIASSNKSAQSYKPVTKLSIRIKQRRIDNPEHAEQSPRLRVNPTKYRTNVISKMSSQQHDFIQAYGISTFKGHKNVNNPHFIGVNLGKVKSFTLCQSFDGHQAAKIIKQEFPAQLVDLSLQVKHSAQNIIYQTFNQVQHKIMSMQSSNRDNSGSTLISAVIDKDMIRVANSGCSHAICETKKGSILKLSQPHTTLNKSEIQRIINNGGSIYQTVVNVPYQDELEIKGPMRISPSGLMYTRCLGKTLDYEKQLKDQNKVGTFQKSLNITWRPQIRYVRTDEVVWLGLFCNNIISNCSIDFIRSVVHKQIKQKSKNYTEHHISMAISKKIIDKLVNDGVDAAMSATIIILSPLSKQTQTQRPVYLAKRKQSQKQIGHRNQSNQSKLTYLGNRKSFVKSISPGAKLTSRSKVGTQSHQSNTSMRNIKKDVSFQSFNDFN